MAVCRKAEHNTSDGPLAQAHEDFLASPIPALHAIWMKRVSRSFVLIGDSYYSYFKVDIMPLQQLKDKSLYYTRWTPKTPSPKLFVLFIHGLGSSHAFYAPIAAQLAADEDFDVIAYDTYGWFIA